MHRNIILDANWVPADDTDLIRRHIELRSAFNHTMRREKAYDYISRVNTLRERKLYRGLAAALVIFGLALLAGCVPGVV